MQIQQNSQTLQRARKSRDARFDGLFFVAVKTTGIYCRPICPANSPLEKNVEYHDTAVSAAQSGFRPCLRCRPDSAPSSSAWLGTQTSFQRALNLINEGALQEGSITELSDRLGISDRYLRELFQQNLGTSPKKYAIYQQCLFAKQLLHETTLPVMDVAYASGFNSVRRFNEAMQQQIGLTPRQVRNTDELVASALQLKLHYRPPYAWQHTLEFLRRRLIPELEWVVDDRYLRTIEHHGTRGYFAIENSSKDNCLKLTLELDDYRKLNSIVQKIKSIFDVDAPIEVIDSQLRSAVPSSCDYLPGLRIPGIWSTFEAGVRAILGQQVAVKQAMNLVSIFVAELGETIRIEEAITKKLFPRPEVVVGHDLAFFKMPQSRKDTIRRLAEHFLNNDDPDDIDGWLQIKGIGPWTVNYVKIRAAKDPDVWLEGDAGINNALKNFSEPLSIEAHKPWRSYLTFHLWNQLS